MNVLISATDHKLEHYAVNMFKSFRLFDKETPMCCIVRDLTKNMEKKLEEAGVTLLQWSYPKSPIDMRNVSLSVANYLPDSINQIMWMDIDALFVHDIGDIWLDDKDDTELVALPGFDGENWIYKQKSGRDYIALGMFISRPAFLKSMWHQYCGYVNRTDKEPDEGQFIRGYQNPIKTMHFEGKFYYCGRDLIEKLCYDSNHNQLFYGEPNDRIVPFCLQFNLMKSGRRPQSKAVDKWIAINLT